MQQTTSRHGTKALKVLVMHTSVVAHQDFAMKMIQWLQSIIAQSGTIAVYESIFKTYINDCKTCTYSFIKAEQIMIKFAGKKFT